MVFLFNNFAKNNFRLFHQSIRLIKYASIQRYPSIMLMTDYGRSLLNGNALPFNNALGFINYLKSLIAKDCLESEIKAS